MQLTEPEILALQSRFEDHFDGRYRKVEDCDDIVTTEENKIAELKDSIFELKVEQAKTNTRLAILIAILSAIAAPTLSVCVKFLFGG